MSLRLKHIELNDFMMNIIKIVVGKNRILFCAFCSPDWKYLRDNIDPAVLTAAQYFVLIH